MVNIDNKDLMQDLPTFDRHTLLRKHYVTADGVTGCEQFSYFLNRLSEHLWVLGMMASRAGEFSCESLQANDQFVCADICVQKLDSIDRLHLLSDDLSTFNQVWESFLKLHNDLATKSKKRDVTESIFLLYFTSCFLSAIDNGKCFVLTNTDEIFLSKIDMLGLAHLLGQRPSVSAGVELARQLHSFTV